MEATERNLGTNLATTLPLVVGLVGAAGSGKTTIARQLVQGSGFHNHHMGRPIKDMLRALGLTEQEVAGSPEDRQRPIELLGGRPSRYALNTLGTNWGRNMISPDLWANAVRARLHVHFAQSPASPVIIDDLRFPNDWRVVSAFGGVLLRVRRPEVEVARTAADRLYYRLRLQRFHDGRPLLGWRPLHETEYHWPDAPVIGEIANDGSEEALAAKVLMFLESEGRWPLNTAGLPEIR